MDGRAREAPAASGAELAHGLRHESLVVADDVGLVEDDAPPGHPEQRAVRFEVRVVVFVLLGLD